MLSNNVKYKKLYLVGDKDYCLNITDKKIMLNTNNNIELVYPNKRNQKIKTSQKYKCLLKERYIVEYVFSKIKNFIRLCMRRDKLDCTYTGFLYLALIMMFKI